MPFLTHYPQLKTIQSLARTEKVKVYLVGGFLRDYLLKRQKFDFDFAVEKNAVPFARRIARKIKGAFVLLDENHGCARVVKKFNGQIWTFDFADFRAKTFAQDLAHRDFTINTLAVDLDAFDGNQEFNEVLLDKRGGIKDLENKKIRMSSTKVFKEDPLRTLRAFSLRANLGFKIDSKTLTQIKKDRELIRSVSHERVRDELFKILETDRAAQTIKEMDHIELLEEIIPQIRVMFGCKQGGYHHLDVWPHSLEVVAQLENVFEQMKNNVDVVYFLNEKLGGERTRRALLKLAALLHDIGKPRTQKKEKGRMTFHGHEHVGKDLTRVIAKMLKLSTDERYALEDIVRWHLRPGYLSNFKKPTERAVYRYFRDTKEEAMSVLLLSLADQRSTRGPLTTQADQRHHEKICLGLIDRHFAKKEEKPFTRLIGGHDLIKTLKLKPSPLFGKILIKIEEAQSLGKISTKKEALDLARKIAKRKHLS